MMTLIQRLREGVTAATSLEVDEEEPFFQILLNSHSPVVLSCLEEGEAMFADLVSVVNPEVGFVSRKTRIRPVATFKGSRGGGGKISDTQASEGYVRGEASI